MEINILKLLMYFLAGVIQDFFFTMNSKYIAKDRVVPAVLYSFLTVLMSMIVLYNILSELSSEKSLLAIIVYSCGIAIGTYVAMRLPKFKFKKRKKK